MVGSAPPSARDSLPGVHAGRESQRGDLENLEGRSLASPLARDEGRFEQSDRWVLPNGAEAYRQFSGTIRLLLARWQNTSVTSTFVVAQIQILVCRTYSILVCHDAGGLREHAKDRARKLTELGYTAFALDLFGE